MTPEEVKLWVNLKHFNARGYNFRRQALIGNYIVDFAEFTQKMVIEVDGSQHCEPDGQQRDAIRDAFFTGEGFTVFRFWNIDVNTAMDGVILTIENALKEPPPSASRPPPP
jgi:very-short-patch-repair endonuclease